MFYCFILKVPSYFEFQIEIDAEVIYSELLTHYTYIIYIG
jgi:hypothetical protein